MSVELEVVRREPGRRARRVAQAAARSVAPPADVELLAAVKYVTPEDMAALSAAGLQLAGENRVEQLIAKQAVARELFTWDFIGHLQSRKARDLAGRVRLAHSLSTLSAAERLDRACEQPIDCLAEVNVAGEESKEGLSPETLDAFLEALAEAAQHPRAGPHDHAAAGGLRRGLEAALRGPARAGG